MNREVSIPAKCQKHPGYKVKRAPTGNCDMCWKLWEKYELRYNLVMGKGWIKVEYLPAPHIPEHKEYGKLIDKWIGRKRV